MNNNRLYDLCRTLCLGAINRLVDATEVEYQGPLSISDVCQPPVRTYMDDLTVTTLSFTSRWLIRGFEKVMNWNRMEFKSGIKIPSYKKIKSLKNSGL